MLTLFSAIRDSRRRRRLRHHDGTTFTSVGAGGASAHSSAYENQAANMKPQVRDELTHDILTNAVSLDNAHEMEEIETCLDQALDMLRAAQEREEFVGMRLKRYQSILRERARELEEADNNSSPLEDLDEQEDARAEASVNTPLCHVTNTGNETIDIENDDDRDSVHVHDKDLVQDTNAVLAHDNDEEVGAPALSPEERQRRVEKLKQDMAALQKVESDYEAMKEHTFTLKKRIFKLERQRDIILQKTAECQEFLLAAAAVEGREEAGLEMVAVEAGDEHHDPVVATSMPQRDENADTATSVMNGALADMNLENGIDDVDSEDDDDDSDFDDDDHYAYNKTLSHDDDKGGTGETVIDKSSE